MKLHTGLDAGNQILSLKRRGMAATSEYGQRNGLRRPPKNRDSNEIVAAVVEGRQAHQIETSTAATIRFPGVNAGVGRPNSALGVNCLIQVAFPCAVGTVNNSFHHYNEPLLITFASRMDPPERRSQDIRKLVQGPGGTSSERKARVPRTGPSQTISVLSGNAVT